MNVDAITRPRASPALPHCPEKTAPYPVVVCGPAGRLSSRVIYQAMLKEAARCMKLGSGPAYADDRLIDLTLKPWAAAEIVEPAKPPNKTAKALARPRVIPIHPPTSRSEHEQRATVPQEVWRRLPPPARYLDAAKFHADPPTGTTT